jgi:hypothetical protein
MASFLDPNDPRIQGAGAMTDAGDWFSQQGAPTGGSYTGPDIAGGGWTGGAPTGVFPGVQPGQPGTSGGGGDVGGSAGIADVGQSLTAHGSKAVDQRVMLNGVSIMTLQAGGNIGGQQPDVGSASEIAIDTSSLSAEGPTGGVRINFIPKDGGNTFGTSTFFTFANESMQGTNYTDALKAAGLATPTKIRNVWDLNLSVGGPIAKDKAWFWFSTRFNRANSFAGVFENKNAFNPNAWTYVPDESAPAENHGEVQQNNLRITWQVAPKVKVAFEQKVDTFCNCPYQAGAIAATSNGAPNRVVS